MRWCNCTIKLNPKPIPVGGRDWDWVHDDYDGPGDPRCGCAVSVADAKKEIEEVMMEYYGITGQDIADTLPPPMHEER